MELKLMGRYKRLLWLGVAMLVGLTLVEAQSKCTVHGYVTDQASGEPLIGATVRVEGVKTTGTVSNNFGFYSLTLPEGEVQLTVSYVGYSSYGVTLNLTGDETLDVALSEGQVLDEVVVTADRNPSSVETTQMSAVTVPMSHLRKIPAIFGENDLIKSLQLLPGVQSGTEGASGLYVRGGAPDQNLVMMDGVPLYNVNHMMGLFSSFNSDAVKNVTLYKGAFPARFGSRLSSVVDVVMKDGHNKEYHGTFQIGLLTSKINVEGPIIKERTTFNVSYRRTYLDLLIRPAIYFASKRAGADGLVDAGYAFDDLNVKLSHKISDKDRLFFSGYYGDDRMHTSTREDDTYSKLRLRFGWSWGNLVTALRWNHLFNGQMFLNTTLSFNRYRSSLKIGAREESSGEISESSSTYNSGIYDGTLRSELNYAVSPEHNLRLGLEYTLHHFRPDVITAMAKEGENKNEMSKVFDFRFGNDPIMAHEFSLFGEDDWEITPELKANIGARYSLFGVRNRVYHAAEPRFGLRYKVLDDLSLKLGYAMMTQNIHLLSNNTVSMPTDLWVPTTDKIAPMTSHQVAMGVFYKLADWGDFSVEGYYKKMSNLLEYKPGAAFLMQSKGWDELVVMGDGTAYGVEFMWQRNFGNLTGWLSYTWSRSMRLFNRPGQELNYGREFPAKYDRVHDVSIAATYKFTKHFDLSAQWVFSTGNTATMPLQYYDGVSEFPNYEGFHHLSTSQVGHIEQRNNLRLPAYHRLDLGMNFYRFHKNGNKSTWNVSVYNAYNQMNAFYVMPEVDSFQRNGDIYKVRKLVKLTLFPIIPAISYSYSF